MEIVTIPIRGSLSHKDSLGSIGNISSGEVQIMSAGSGIQHSEFNGSDTDEINLLQIWIFPKQHNIEPRYEQNRYDLGENNNSFVTVVSSEKKDDIMWINQDAALSLGDFDAGITATYSIKHPGNGVYVFLIDGEVELDGTVLRKRDAAGVYNTDSLELLVKDRSRILIIEVPMN